MQKVITEEIAARVKADQAYQNAMKNSRGNGVGYEWHCRVEAFCAAEVMDRAVGRSGCGGVWSSSDTASGGV